MCGIAGIINYKDKKINVDILDKMLQSIAHRGPDNHGKYIYKNTGFVHSRLSVIDPSDKANQPFTSDDGNFVIIYNGTVYNFKVIKKELVKKGYKFSTRSDTEVVLKSYIEWGAECLNKFNGIFAFALLDKKNNKIFFARDRYGAKPLYYYKKDHLFIFASELKVFKQHNEFKKEIDLFALKEYFSFQNVFSDRTLYKDVRLMPSGSWGKLNIKDGNWQIKRYWDFDFSEKLDIDYDQAVKELQGLIENAVNKRLVSDVPLGSYLSGGMDSSSLVSIAGESIADMPTFTGGFYMEGVKGREAEFDEREKAEYTANYFNLPNYQVIMNSKTMPNILCELVYYNDDLRVGQCWQNYTVAHLASRFVKVVLCGAGGDELFGGYPWRYKIAEQSKNLDEFNDNYFNYWQRMVPEDQMKEFFAPEIYNKIKDYELKRPFNNIFSNYEGKYDNFYDRIFYFELKTFLQGLLLVEDKISMAHGLETRAPFLDNNLVDFIIKLPFHHKIDKKGAYKGKKILKDALKGIIPERVLNYKKQGFSPPDENWYRNETSDYIKKELLNSNKNLRKYVKEEFIETIYNNHVNENQNNRLLIWSLLSFKNWLKEFN
ncbi:MAG: asparagine synthase (glutamine-hydrolyzing) [Elusimicrobiota bacterium]